MLNTGKNNILRPQNYIKLNQEASSVSRRPIHAWLPLTHFLALSYTWKAKRKDTEATKQETPAAAREESGLTVSECVYVRVWTLPEPRFQSRGHKSKTRHLTAMQELCLCPAYLPLWRAARSTARASLIQRQKSIKQRSRVKLNREDNKARAALAGVMGRICSKAATRSRSWT